MGKEKRRKGIREGSRRERRECLSFKFLETALLVSDK